MLAIKASTVRRHLLANIYRLKVFEGESMTELLRDTIVFNMSVCLPLQ